MLVTLRNLYRYQQAQRGIVSDMLLANEGCGIGLNTGVVIGPAEPDVLGPVLPPVAWSEYVLG